MENLEHDKSLINVPRAENEPVVMATFFQDTSKPKRANGFETQIRFDWRRLQGPTAFTVHEARKY